MSALRDVGVIARDHAGISRVVLDYTLEMKRTVDRAKEPGFSARSWGPLARFVTPEGFTRIGPFKDKMDWSEYVAFLTSWAPSAYWQCSFRRITEAGNLVFLELEERIDPSDPAAAVNSLSVYSFDDAGKINHLDVYLQMAPPA